MYLRSEPYHYYVFVFLRSAVSSPLLVAPSLRPPLQNAVLASAARIFLRVVVGTAHKLHHGADTNWNEIIIIGPLQSLPPPPHPPHQLLPHTPRVSCRRVFWPFRTVTKNQAVKSVFPTSAIRILRQHNPETISAKITLT